MTREERSAAYTFISLLEGSVKRLNKSSIKDLFSDKRFQRIGGENSVREFRNLLVHSPEDFVSLYGLVKKHCSVFRNILTACQGVTGMYPDEEPADVIRTLLLCYKREKEE